ncbi:gamma-glutamylcyclotransferase family protein [Microbacterium sp. 18062]|uniref:gamma-glutamylcyclotransferase family protein n=1 Tax=Microbacterium sp. 18062 TaxID=2681410 RepID=UPI00135C8C22|nr:gamma-glutamylcyclotransferase family protein [Microbacterium sp. 18062]
MAAPADQLLFAYGALQHPDVQLDTFGRLVETDDDVLPGYALLYIEAEDTRTANPSGTTVLPVLRRTDGPRDKVVGIVLSLTADELDAADEYQMSLYRRTPVTLASGRAAWVYVGRPGRTG